MKIDINKVAKLANIPLEPKEKKMLESQLLETLDYVKHLEDIDTKTVEPTSQVTGLENVLREDVAGKSFTQEEALKNATKTHNGFFVVPAILEQ